MIAVLKRKENAVDRALDDPPRRDYSTRTRARPRRYVVGTLGTDDLSIATDAAATAVLRASAYWEALVRADERAMGARSRNQPDLEQERLAEAARLLDGALESGVVAAGKLSNLSIVWAAVAQSRDVRRASVGPRPEGEGAVDLRSLLRPRARKAFERTGLVVDDLDVTVHVSRGDRARPVEDQILESARRTRRLAQTTRALGQQIHRRPTLEGTRTPESPGISMAALTRGIEWDWDVPERDQDDLSAAEARDVSAIFELGLVERDRGETSSAERLFRQAAARGNADAMFELSMIERDRGEFSSAERWLREAALTVRRRQSRPTRGQ
jgi:hypothetical protein